MSPRHSNLATLDIAELLYLDDMEFDFKINRTNTVLGECIYSLLLILHTLITVSLNIRLETRNWKRREVQETNPTLSKGCTSTVTILTLSCPSVGLLI
jgi:hypothetical protein